MIIAPKISDIDIEHNESLLKYMRGYYEIQILKKDLSEAFVKIEKVIYSLDKNKDTKEVTIHTPFPSCLIEHTLLNGNMYLDVICLLNKLGELSLKTGIKLKLLFHFNVYSKDVIYTHVINNLRVFLKEVEKRSLTVIVENSLVNISNYSTIPIVELSNAIDNPSLEFCLDLCHWVTSENVLQTSLEIPKSASERITSVHFSATLLNDGYKDKPKTHGRMHETLEDLIRDVQRLKELGIDLNTTTIVTEISEEDYKNRPDMIRELAMLHSLT